MSVNKLMEKNKKYLKRAKELGLNQKEFDNINRAFCLFDQDGNGKISRGEIREVVKAIGRPMSEREIEEMMRNADLDGSGYVEFHEFLPLIAHEFAAKQGVDKEVRETFRSFDQNGDGVITAREFRSAVARLGQNLSDAEVAEFLRSVDKDGDGVISYEEFAKYVVSNM
ncbi:squidulin [Biomphalaria glabrata]|uniref:Squidulin-like n=1 Tax=Biomphalaria glabrata TaxID=6526 RepID=A0A2C9L2N6_BIOGL|nr:squidulin-like [Biomphalaria glabrata]XP_013068431.1 squidulin-like [Biomphalaria glabrata]KAI8732715.1 squidulin-like [Biomphalaria glabrata]KAI8776615.1 squidulin [Biomphalaria glabrata]